MSLKNSLQEWSENKNLIQTLVMLSVGLCLLSGFVWWTKVHQSTQNVFWGMLENSLATQSVTRESISEGATSSVQKTRVSFGEQIQSHGFVTVNQSGEEGETKVVSENIGTRDADFVRYVSVDTGLKNKAGQDMDFSSVEGRWAKIDTEQGNPTFLSDYAAGSIFGAVPFGNLDADKRQELLRFARDKNIFDIDFAKVTKKENESGRTVYVYSATISPLDYINFLKMYLESVGLKKEGIEGVDFSGAAPVQVEYRIDPVSHLLTSFKYIEGDYLESYSGWGIHDTAQVPDEYISEQQLAQTWQSILTGSVE